MTYAFMDCVNLTNVTLPDSLVTIASRAFNNCNKLKSIVIPNKVTKLGSYSFAGCNILVDVTLGDSVKNIGANAFYKCTALKNITIPDSVQIIYDNAFTSCSNLTNVYINDIAAWCGINFNGSTGFNPLSYAKNLYVNGTLTTDIVIPDGVTTIPDRAFYSFDSITSITIPDSVTSIGHTVFVGCINLKSAVIGKGITSIPYALFSGCSKLESVVLPNSITSISNDAFNNCSNVTVYYCGTAEEWANISIDKDNESKILTGKAVSLHDYTVETKDATCGIAGKITKTCQICGNVAYEEIAATGEHTYGDGVVTAPTCTETGYTTYTCTACGYEHKTDEVAALGHVCDDGVVTSPTETVHGYTTYTCTVCGYVYKDSHVPATGEGIVNGVQNMQITQGDTNIIVTWNEIAGATKYLLYVKNSDGQLVIVRELDSNATSVTLSWPTELEWDETYSIGIRARTKTWLTTVYKDAALVVGNRIVDVKTQSVGRTIKVDWRAYEGATQYYVYVYEKGSYPTAFTSVKATTNSATIINAINPEIDYEVRVIATKGVTKMKTADALSIDARLNVFTPDTFTERCITPTKVGVGFDEVRGADKYWVYLTPVDGGETIIKESTRSIAAVSGLSPNTTYNVQIQARVTDVNGEKHYSGISAVLGTITTTEWEEISISTRSGAYGGKIIWNAPTNVCGYIIYRSTDGGNRFTRIATISDATTIEYIDADAKNGYIYAIVAQLQDDFVTTRAPLVKSRAIIK